MIKLGKILSLLNFDSYFLKLSVLAERPRIRCAYTILINIDFQGDETAIND